MSINASTRGQPLKLVLFCYKNASIVTVSNNNNLAVKLIQKLGQRISAVTQDSRKTGFLFQRLSMALQRGNVVSFHNTFTIE